MVDYEARIHARLALLTEERARYLDQARAQMSAYDAAIGELTRLIEPPADLDGAGEPADAEHAVVMG